jgi:glycine cleavage system pyridoxal-binding protein P
MMFAGFGTMTFGGRLAGAAAVCVASASEPRRYFERDSPGRMIGSTGNSAVVVESTP